MTKQLLVIVGIDGGSPRRDGPAFASLIKTHRNSVLTSCRGCDPNGANRLPVWVTKKLRGIWVLEFDDDKSKKDWFKQEGVAAFLKGKVYFIHAADAACQV